MARRGGEAGWRKFWHDCWQNYDQEGGEGLARRGRGSESPGGIGKTQQGGSTSNRIALCHGEVKTSLLLGYHSLVW